MISRIHAATIVVSDQDAAIDFYTNVLGWKTSIDTMVGESMRFLTVVPPGGGAELALGVEGWFENGLPPKQTGISMIAEDIDATYASLVEKGVRFKAPVQQMPWGDKGTWFFDPDDNEFFLAGT